MSKFDEENNRLLSALPADSLELQNHVTIRKVEGEDRAGYMDADVTYELDECRFNSVLAEIDTLLETVKERIESTFPLVRKLRKLTPVTVIVGSFHEFYDADPRHHSITKDTRKDCAKPLREKAQQAIQEIQNLLAEEFPIVRELQNEIETLRENLKSIRKLADGS